MSRATELLEQATPLPWGAKRSEFAGRSFIGKGPKGGGLLVAECWYSIGPRGELREGNAELIVYAVNRLPAYEAAVEALERILVWAPRSPDTLKARHILSRLRDKVPA